MRSYAAPRARRLPARPDPELAPVRLLRLEGGERTRDDRRRRGGLLRRIDSRRSGSSILSVGRALAVRDRVGGDPRREHSRASRSTRRSRSSSGTRCAGIPPWRGGHRGLTRRSEHARSREGGHVKRRRWYLLAGAAVVAVATLSASGSRGGGLVEPGADEGHHPAQVGHTVAVRRLLRGEGQGLLQGGGPRREHQGRRPGHHHRADRALEAGRVRRQLVARACSRTATRATTSSTSRQVYSRIGHDRGDLEDERDQRTSARCAARSSVSGSSGTSSSSARRSSRTG